MWDPEKDVVITSSDIVFPPPSPIAHSSSTAVQQPSSPSVPPSSHDNDHPSLHPDLPEFDVSSANAVLVDPAKAFAQFIPSPSPTHAPKSHRQAAMNDSHLEDWKTSMQQEIGDLERRNTWDLVPYRDVPRGASIALGN